MAPIVSFERRSQIADATTPIPAMKRRSILDFRPPPTLESDFRRLLEHDVPHINANFEQVQDWFAALEDEYEPIIIRAQQTPIDWKSKIGNSDMSTNFKVTHDRSIRKGDMVIREDGTVFLLNWNIQNHANNQATQSIECNVVLQVTRDMPEETDEHGMLISEGETKDVVPGLPCVQAEYAGRPDYAANQGMPGIHADHLVTIHMQWNDKTKDILINDEFVMGKFTYRVVNISIAEVHIEREHGILILHARRVAGGELDG